MEDAAIHDIDLGNLGDGNSLFAVFDGHGGFHFYMKDIKLVNTSKKSLYQN
jgi:serine/threonine protein phosphatase PrpC